MVLTHHKVPKLRYEQQYQTAKHYIIPWISLYKPISSKLRVLDVGCGEGGVLRAFGELECTGVGIDLNPNAIELARFFAKEDGFQTKLQFLHQNIYELDGGEAFDVIIFKDSLEHIPNQGQILAHVRRFLRSDGVVFVGFPPWLMPFGGHQQVLPVRFWAFLPYYHLLPASLYRLCLRLATKDEALIAELLELKALGLFTHRFEAMASQAGYRIIARKLWLISPIYRYKFGLRPTAQSQWLAKIPYLRDFISTAAYYLLAPSG